MLKTGAQPQVNLGYIPTSITINNQIFHLVGIINYKSPSLVRSLEIESIGNYTAITLRKNKIWIEYDDQKSVKKPKKYSKEFTSTPHVIMYSV